VVNLGGVKNICRIVCFTSNWVGANPKTLQVLVSNSYNTTINMTKVGELVRGGVNPAPWGGVLSFDFPDISVTGQYVQFYMPDTYGTLNTILQAIVYEKAE
jgi:hypothetical protein